MENVRKTYDEAIVLLYSEATLNHNDTRQRIGSYLKFISLAKNITSDLKEKAYNNYR